MTDDRVTNRRPIADGFRRLATRPVQWCVAQGIHPNTVSYASLWASAGAAACLMASKSLPWLLLVGVALCFVRLYFNMLDGMVALASGKASATGEIANELPDRISDVLIFVGLGHSGWCQLPLAYGCAILSLLVAYVGTLGQAVGAGREFAGPMSKPWRMVALAVGAVATCVDAYHDQGQQAYGLQLQWLDLTCTAILAGCVITIARRLQHIVGRLNQNAEGL